MSYNETIDNYLYDEENEYTQANDLWEDFFMEKKDEIDERPWIQADGPGPSQRFEQTSRRYA